MQTWSLGRFVHIGAIVFFVAGQLMLVAAVGPAIGNAATSRRCASSPAALASAAWRRSPSVVATGVAMVSHPDQPSVSYGVAAASLLVVWLGVKLTYG
jgi:hypothetical protein